MGRFHYPATTKSIVTRLHTLPSHILFFSGFQGKTEHLTSILDIDLEQLEQLPQTQREFANGKPGLTYP